MSQVVLIDNYDSFVYNLARYLERLGQTTHVVRNDALGPEQLRALRPAAVILSPGPCTPEEAGNSLDLVRHLHAEVPLLGVCLGHQIIAAALGARIVRGSEPMHGRTSRIFHDGRGIFQGVPTPFEACRYHSLVVDEATLPGCLDVTARTSCGIVMGLRHRSLPVMGVQFHPESILTEAGYVILASFLRLAGLQVSGTLPKMEDELQQTKVVRDAVPAQPVTF